LAGKIGYPFWSRRTRLFKGAPFVFLVTSNPELDNPTWKSMTRFSLDPLLQRRYDMKGAVSYL